MDTVSPSQTLYINNINEKIKKDVLKKTLYMLFRQYGKIIEIVACKGITRRGQAWVVFEDVAAATNAMRSKDGFNFYDKPLRIVYSRNKSDIVAKKEGTYVPGMKRPSHVNTKNVDKTSSGSSAMDTTESNADLSTVEQNKKVKLIHNATPYHILFAQQLPSSCTVESLTNLCSNYVGFKEVRGVPSKDIAFIEFEDHVQATVALEQLNNFKLNDSNELLHLTYSKQ